MSKPQPHFVYSWKSLVRMGHSLVGGVHCRRQVDSLVGSLVDSLVDSLAGLCHRHQCTTHNLADNSFLYLLLVYIH